jgi:hypothetical protein
MALIMVRSLERPDLLPPERRAVFFRAYWRQRLAGTHPETAGYKAFAIANDSDAEDDTTIEGERMWWKERGAQQ